MLGGRNLGPHFAAHRRSSVNWVILFTLHPGYRLKFGIAAALILAGVGVFHVFGGASQSGNISSDAPAQLTFEQDGQTFAIVDGNAYQIHGSGRRTFVDRLFDPDFHKKNYRVQEGKVFQVDPTSGTLYPVTRTFREGFEGAASADDLFTAERWHASNVDPKRAGQKDNYYALGNRVTLSRDVVHTGEAALRCYAVASATDVSKASIWKGIMYFKKGDDVYFSGWFFIEDTPSLYDAGAFTLFDLESTFMKSVGLRTIFRVGDSLTFELELPKTQFRQDRGAEVSFPTGRWVHIETHAFLSDEAGLVQIWQDGRKVLEKKGRTLPLADSVYDRFEIGVTGIAQGSKYEKIVYVDDVTISDSPIRD